MSRVERIDVPMGTKLRRLVERAADKANVPMGRLCREIIAEHLGNPRLADVPRSRVGRPRRKR